MSAVVEKILRGAAAEKRSALLEHEVYEILREAGLDVPRYVFWAGSPAKGLPAEVREFIEKVGTGEVVLKIVSPQILHKSDVGGLSFCRRDPDEVLAQAEKIWQETGRRMPEADRRGLLLMERIEVRGAGIVSELLLSVKQDPSFGPVLVLGLGGLLTEWYGKFSLGTSTAVLQPGAVDEGLTQLTPVLPMLSLLFQPSRQHRTPPLDRERTVRALESLGRLAAAYGPGNDSSPFTLEELEMNPMLLAADGRLVAVDGVGSFSESKSTDVPRPLRKIGNLLHPGSAVVVGASSKGMNPGRIILRNLRVSTGIPYGHLYVIHPKEESIDGLPCFRSLDALPEKVDLAVVSLPAEGARDSIRALCEKDLASSIILIPGGFAETGRKDLEEEIIRSMRDSRRGPGGGPVLVGGNCLGIVSKNRYNTFFLPQYKLPFHDAPGESLVAVSQSGAYLVTLTSNLDGIIFPRASISYGNQMDLTVSDFLEFYASDESVKVIACYIEGFKPRDGERFVRLARALRARGARVIVYKGGKTPLGAKAAQSHTASLAGNYAVARSLLLQAGALVADTLDMFEDYTKVCTMLWERVPLPPGSRGRRVGIVSNAGFECSSVLDKLYNLELAPLADETRRSLQACLPAMAHADNPIDATPMATTAQFIEATRALLRDPAVDALIVSPIPVTPALDDLAPDLAGTHLENIFAPQSLPQELLRVFRESDKPVVVSVDSGRLYDDFVTLLQRGGIPVFRKIDRASRALSALCTL